MASAVRWASAMIVSIGFVPLAVGKAEPSPIHTPGVSWSSPNGPGDRRLGSVPMRALPMWCGRERRVLEGRERRVVDAPRVGVDRLLAAPHPVLALAMQRQDLLCARGVVHPRQRPQPVAEVREVHPVAERVGVDGVAGAVDGHAPVAAVAQHEDQRRGDRGAGHVLLVLAAGLPRDGHAGDAGRGVSGLHEVAVAVGQIAVLVGQARSVADPTMPAGVRRRCRRPPRRDAGAGSRRRPGRRCPSAAAARACPTRPRRRPPAVPGR